MVIDTEKSYHFFCRELAKQIDFPELLVELLCTTWACITFTVVFIVEEQCYPVEF